MYSNRLPTFALRMPPELKEKVKAFATANERSLNSEIVHVLKNSYAQDALAVDAQRQGTSLDTVPSVAV